MSNSNHLPNYLRAHRKRTGLSQAEVAFLLGCRSGAKVSKYERFHREPTLKTALAYEALFETPVRELFRGVGDDAERETLRRARHLARRLRRRREDPRFHRKLAALHVITDRESSEVRYEPVNSP
jgi:transcriptional regulator with XRE-family HTH domain